MPQYNPLISVAGLNTDNLEGNIPQGSVTFAYNAVVSSFDRSYISYSTEGANEFCTNPKEGFRVIGRYNITEQQRLILFLVNPETGENEIGEITNEGCEYKTIIFGNCLNFSLEHPIHQIEVKTTNCSTEIYWTDNHNDIRWLNLDDLPWKEIPDPTNDYKKIKLEGQLDCNKLLIQANFSIPKTEIKSVQQGGNLTEGTVQFATAYSNNLGETYTSFYNVTNPVSIKEGDRATQIFDLPTGQSVTVRITDLDTTGLFDYFVLVVIETINAISTIKQVGIYPITNETKEITYTGSETLIQVTPEQLFQRFQYYDLAQGVTQSDDRVIFYGVKEKQRIVYQDIWSKVKLLWETHKIPYTESEAYKNPMNTYLYKGYMRDEVYALEGVFILKNGKTTEKFHISGRKATDYDRELIDIENQDSIGSTKDPCGITVSKERWQVYNTGSVIGYSPEYIGNETNLCYKGPYQYGEFSYWESEEKVFNNPVIWGDLANTQITHPKFPDEAVTPRFSVENGQEFIYPIGIKIDVDSFYQAIQDSSLTQEQKDEIVGFKIVRGNRQENMSVRGKGLMFNVGKTTHNEQEFLFPNYPYNDLRKDPYFVTDDGESDVKHGIKDHSGYRPDRSINAFGDHSKSRFTIHSPDAYFGRIESVNTGILKLESIDYGTSKGHFVQVKNNAQYKFLTPKMSYASLGVGVASGFTLAAGTFGWPTFDISQVLPAYSQAEDIWKKVSPYTNFGYMYTSKADYLKSEAIPNNGYKIRAINDGKYLSTSFDTVENGISFNNKLRESAIYLNTINDFKFPHEYSVNIPEDNSRFTISSYSNFSTLENFIPQGIPSITDEEIKQAIGLTDFSDNVGIYVFTVTPSYPCTPGDIYLSPGTTGDFSFNIVDVNSTLVTASVVSGTGTFIPTTNTLTLQTAIDTPTESETFITFTTVTQTSENYNDILVSDVRQVLNQIQSLQDFQSLSSTGIEGIAADAILIGFAKLNTIQDPESYRYSSVSAYYASLKSYLPSQWGRLYSYTTVDTGYYQKLFDEGGNKYSSFPTIFGGDTFINKFSLKKKLPLFDLTTYGAADDADINYKKQGNLGYPMYWISTEYENFDIDIQPEVDKIIEKVESSPGVGGGGSFFSKLWSVISGILSGGASNVVPVMAAMVGILRKLYLRLGRKNINLDNASQTSLIEQGLMYMYVYGVPTFFVESQVNIDLRQATNDNEGNFYPRVGQEVPDDWFQEERVPIVNDNNYTYNKTFSKQNTENEYLPLREDFDPTKLCYTEFPNRAIWSEKSNLRETFNNWLIFKPVSNFDFPKSYGKLTSLDGIANGAVLARFENKTQVYNALTTIDTSTFQAYLGNANLFSTRPQDFSETDGGALGSQHKFLLKMSEGLVYVDSKRGQVVLYRGESPQVISDLGNSRWFSENLPFKIAKSFPGIDTDNNFKNIGITGVYDEENHRILITKCDYQLITSGVSYSEGKFFYKGQEIFLDSEHFCNKSWTISFSFLTNSWISYHSYIPNYYVSYPNFFQSGISSGLWNHNTDFTKYHTFYNKIEPYIIEYPLVYSSQQDQVIQSVRDYCTALIYENRDISYEPSDILYFNKFEIYNKSQHTGTRNLIPKPQNNLFILRQYPKYNANSIDVLVDKKDSWISFNGIWDSVKQKNKPFLQTTCSVIMEVDNTNIDYSRKPYKNYLIRSKEARIRLILDDKNNFKLTSRLVLAQSDISNA